MDLHCPHDKLFKTTLSHLPVAIEFFQFHLPEKVRTLIDFSALKVCKESYVNKKLELSCSDMLFETKFKDKPGFLYLLCEHQSSVDPYMPLRLWQYMTHIWSDHLKKNKKNKSTNNKAQLPFIFPMVFYHGKKAYDGCRDLRELISAPLDIINESIFGPFHLIDTHEIPDETLREQNAAGILGMVYKHIYQRDILVVMDKIASMLKNYIDTGDPHSSDLSYTFVYYLSNVAEISKPKEFFDIIETKVSKDVGEKTMKMPDYFRKEGKIEQLLTFLSLKFGQIPSRYTSLVQNASLEQLQKWENRFLIANNYEEFFEA